MSGHSFKMNRTTCLMISSFFAAGLLSFARTCSTVGGPTSLSAHAQKVTFLVGRQNGDAWEVVRSCSKQEERNRIRREAR